MTNKMIRKLSINYRLLGKNAMFIDDVKKEKKNFLLFSYQNTTEILSDGGIVIVDASDPMLSSAPSSMASSVPSSMASSDLSSMP